MGDNFPHEFFARQFHGGDFEKLFYVDPEDLGKPEDKRFWFQTRLSLLELCDVVKRLLIGVDGRRGNLFDR